MFEVQRIPAPVPTKRWNSNSNFKKNEASIVPPHDVINSKEYFNITRKLKSEVNLLPSRLSEERGENYFRMTVETGRSEAQTIDESRSSALLAADSPCIW